MGKIQQVLAGHRAPTACLAFCHTNSSDLVISASHDGTVCVWDVTSGGPAIHTFEVSSCPYALATSPVNPWVAVGCGEGSIWLFDAVSGEQKQKIAAHPDTAILSLAFATDSTGVTTLVSASEDCEVKLWEFESNTNEVLRSDPTSTFSGFTVSLITHAQIRRERLTNDNDRLHRVA